MKEKLYCLIIVMLLLSNVFTLYLYPREPKQDINFELPRFWSYMLIEMRHTEPTNRLRIFKTYMSCYDLETHGMLPAAAVPIFEDLFGYHSGHERIAVETLEKFMCPDPGIYVFGG